MSRGGGIAPGAIEFAPFPDAPRIRTGEAAYRDLEMADLYRAVHRSVPGDGFWCRDYIRTELERPFTDAAAIRLRQDAIQELLGDSGLYAAVSGVKTACEAFKYRRAYNGGMVSGRGAWRDSLQKLENAALLVELAAALGRIGTPSSRRLSEVALFGELLAEDGGLVSARRFVEEVYRPHKLGDAVYAVRRHFEQTASRPGTGRDEMEEGARVIADCAGLVIEGDFCGSRGEREAQRLVRAGRGRFGRRRGAEEAAASLVDGLNLLMDRLLPPVRPGNLDGELSLYLGAAGLCRRWTAAGVPSVKPLLLAREERRCDIRDGRNISLLAVSGDGTVPSNIAWDRNGNVFVITGPNNGGKTTYLRMTGQLVWMAQAGLLLPAAEAALSLVDGIFTSFAGGDEPSRGEGHYAAELSRLAGFLLHGGGPVTPYSLVLMDEFATGTDHEEAARITGVVLEHISERGTAAFFTTHRPEAADLVEKGGLPGGVNLAPEVRFENGAPLFTYRMRRNAREKSYGHLQAERIGITAERLRAALEEQVARGMFGAGDTRRAGAAGEGGNKDR
jgi:hypothetical protein